MARSVTMGRHGGDARGGHLDGVARFMPTTIAALIFAAEFLRIRQWWFLPGRSQFGYPEHVARGVLEGTARAPDQYRVLAPHLAQLLADVLRVPLPTGLVLLDVTSTVATVAVLHRLCARLGARPLIVAAALGWTWWASKLEHWDPSVAPLAAVVTATALVLADRRPYPLRTTLAVLVLGAAALGLRSDYAAGLGVVALAAGLRSRSWAIALSGTTVLAAAPLVTRALTLAYPQAHYESDVVQLAYNLSPAALAAVGLFYSPPLLVLAASAVRRRALPTLWFVPVWFLGELAVTFVVGRPDETRIFLPFAPVLALAATLAYLELRDRPAAEAAQHAHTERVSVTS